MLTLRCFKIGLSYFDCVSNTCWNFRCGVFHMDWLSICAFKENSCEFAAFSNGALKFCFFVKTSSLKLKISNKNLGNCFGDEIRVSNWILLHFDFFGDRSLKTECGFLLIKFSWKSVALMERTCHELAWHQQYSLSE